MYLYVLSVAVFVGRPSVVVVVEPGLSRKPAFVIETRRSRDLVVCDLSGLHAECITTMEGYKRIGGAEEI